MSNTTNNQEIWKACPGHNRYEISNFGRIKTVRTGEIHKTHVNKRNGYLFAVIMNDDRNKDGEWTYHTVNVHSLVSRAFHGDTPEGMQIDHINQDRTDASESNLRFVTQSENIRRSKHRYVKGIPLSPGQHAAIKFLWEHYKVPQTKLAKQFNCNNSTVCKIVNGKSNPRKLKEYADGSRGEII